MTDVSFQEPSYAAPAQATVRKPSFLTRLMLSWGLAKDEQGAQQALLVIAAIALIAAAGIFFMSPTNRPARPVPPANHPGVF